MKTSDTTHPSRDDLFAYLAGKLNAVDSESIETHLNQCESCCDVLSAAPSQDTIDSMLRQQEADTSISPETPADPDESPREDGIAPTIVPESAEETRTPRGEVTAIPGLEADSLKLPPELRDHPRYKIVELLGHGGMGDVYRAEHKVMNRQVALKVIKPQLVQSDAAVRRFQREVQAAARLEHTNIVTAFDAEQAGDLHYLVMSFVDGVDLDEVIRERGPLPVEEACDYIRQAADGLQYAHQQGMVHRDIKPHNLMVEGMGNAERGMGNEEGDSAFRIPNSALLKILDFGLANFANEVAEDELHQADDSGEAEQQSVESHVPGASILHQLTQMGTMMGTPDYIAPEQAEDAHTADIRSDIYSLGCTFYTLLTGKAPFGEGSVMDKVKAHTEEDAPKLSEFRDDVPAEVEAVLQKMMAKDPAERFQTPAEVAEALEVAGASSPSSGSKMLPPRKRRPLVLTAVAALFLAVLAAVVFYIQTDNGVVRVEVTDPSLNVSIAGQTITAGDGGKPLTIRAGEQKLIVRQKDSDFELVTDSFQLRRGDRIVLKVDLRPGQVVVSKDGERFGAKPLPTEPAHDEPTKFYRDLEGKSLATFVRRIVEEKGGRVVSDVDSKTQYTIVHAARIEEASAKFIDFVFVALRDLAKRQGVELGETELERGEEFRQFEYVQGDREGVVQVSLHSVDDGDGSLADATKVMLTVSISESTKDKQLIAEWQRLDGRWRGVSGSQDARKLTSDEARKMELLVNAEERTMTFLDAGDASTGKVIDLQPSASPKRVDLKIDSNGAMKLMLGIYKFEGNDLTICLGHAGRRPVSFTTHPGRSGGDQLFVLRRAQSETDNEIRVVYDEQNGNGVLAVEGERFVQAVNALTRIRDLFSKNPQLTVVLDAGPEIDRTALEDLMVVDGVLKMIAATGASVRLAPALQIARETATERNTRRNILNKIGIALHTFAEKHQFFPPGDPQKNPEWFDDTGRPHLSWRVHLLPIFDQKELYERFRVNEPWDSPHNKPLLAEMPAMYKTTDDPTKTTLLAVVGEGTGYQGKAGLLLKDFKDGLSNIAYVVDAGRERAVPWTKPEDLPFDKEDPIRTFGTSDFGDVFLALMADTSVQSIPYDTAPESLRALFTRAAGDKFDETAKRTTPLPKPPEIRHLKAIGGSTSPIRAAFVPDMPAGKRVVMLTGATTLQMWDAERDVLLWSKDFDVHTVEKQFDPPVRPAIGGGRLFVVSKDFIALATGGVGDRCALLGFHTDSGELFHLSGQHKEITELRILPDGKTLIVVAGGREITYTIDLDGKVDVRTDYGRGAPDHDRDKLIQAVKPDQLTSLVHLSTETMALGTSRGRILLFDKTTHKTLGELTGHSAAVVDLSRVSAMGLVSASKDKTIRVWDIATKRELIRLTIAEGQYDWIDVSADGKRLLAPPATLEQDATGAESESKHQAHIWQLPQSVWPKKELERAASFKGHTGPISGVMFSPDGKLAASFSGGEASDGTVLIWNVDDGKVVRKVEYGDEPPTAIAFSPDSKRIAIGGADFKAYVYDVHGYDLATKKYAIALTIQPGPVNDLAFTPDGANLLIWSERQGTFWSMADPRAGELKELFQGQANAGRMAISRDGLLVALGNSDPDTDPVAVIHLKQQRTISLTEDIPPVTDIAFLPDSKRFIVTHAVAENPASLYDTTTEIAKKLRGFDVGGAARGLAVTPDGRHVMIADDTSRLTIWNVETGEKVDDFTTPEIVTDLDISPDGKTLLTGGGYRKDGDRLVSATDFDVHLSQLPERVWPHEPPVELSLEQTLKGHSGLGMSTASLAATADGRRLITAGGKDKTARLWNTTSGETLFIMPMENDGPVSVAITSDGKLGAVRGTNGHIDLWDLVEQKKLRSLDQTEVRGAAMAFSADGWRLVTGALPAGDHKPLSIVWDVETGERLHVHRFPFDEPVGAIVAVPGTDDVIFTAKRYWRWNTVSGKLAPLPDWPESLGGDLDISSDGKLAAIVTNETVTLKPVRKKFSVQLRELETGRLVKTLETTEAELSQLAAAEMPTCTCFVAGDQRVAVGYMHGEIRVFEIASGRMIAHKTNILPAPNLVALSDHRIASTGLSREDHGIRIWQLPQSVPPGEAMLRRSLSALVELKADGLTPNEAKQWLEREAPFVRLDSPLTHLALQLLAELPATSHQRLLADGYLRWRPDQFDPRRRAQHSEMVQWYVGWAFRVILPAGGRKGRQEELTAWLLENADVGFAVVDLPGSDGAMICWCLIAREDLPFPGSFPLIGMPSEVDKARGKELLVAQADRLRELREQPVSPVPDGGWPAAETPTYEALRKQALALYTFEKDTFYQRDGQKYVRDVSGNGHDALIQDDKPAYSPDGKIGGALLCNHTDSTSAPLEKLQLPAAFVSGKHEYTIVMWVQTTAVSDESTSVLYRESIPGKKFATPTLFQLADARLQAFSRGYYAEASTSASEAATPAGSIPSDRWFFLALALTRKPSHRMLHITIDDKRWEDDYTKVSNLKDGFGFLGGIDGMVDEVAFFDRALTGDEIQSLRNGARPEE